MKCMIYGMFWQGHIDVHRGEELPTRGMHSFFGEIDLNKDGVFTGLTTDKWGDARINGNLSATALQFTKVYTRKNADAGAVGAGLQYLLKGHNIEGVHGGWIGMYLQDGEGGGTRPGGQAIRIIHPDQNN